jgi:hypothetical protein
VDRLVSVVTAKNFQRLGARSSCRDYRNTWPQHSEFVHHHLHWKYFSEVDVASHPSLFNKSEIMVLLVGGDGKLDITLAPSPCLPARMMVDSVTPMPTISTISVAKALMCLARHP